MPANPPRKGPVMLIVMDGIGLRKETEHNAVHLAKKPNYDRLKKEYPYTQIITCGTDVGLPKGTMGNSEVGHLNIGAGRVVWQELMRIGNAVADLSFFENKAFVGAIEHAKKNNARLHLFGLISGAFVHSCEEHYFALIRMARQQGLTRDRVVIHIFTDGRDTPPRSGAQWVADFQRKLDLYDTGVVGTVIGRYYAMDRDKRWSRVKLAYDAMVHGVADRSAKSAGEAIAAAYARADKHGKPHTKVIEGKLPEANLKVSGALDRKGLEDLQLAVLALLNKGQYRIVADLSGLEFLNSAAAAILIDAHTKAKEKGGSLALLRPNASTMKTVEMLGLNTFFEILGAPANADYPAETDEFIRPTVILGENGKPQGVIRDGDALISFNHRSDRPREIIRALIEDDFEEKTRKDQDRGFVRRGRPKNLYLATMTDYRAGFDVPVAFDGKELAGTISEAVSKAGLKQYHTAETEKYPHVTFFFNGGREAPFPGEDRYMANSPKVATYDLQPEMSAAEVTQKVCEAIRSKKYDFFVLNFANGDMVGHTGVEPAAIKAVETVDKGVGEIVQALKEVNGEVLITADHGNCEQMWDYDANCPHTSHTTNPVPCFLVSERFKNAKLRSGGRLADLAPTLMFLLGLPPTPEMDGKNLVQP